MSIIDSLKWRYATKKFDSSKKVSDENLSKIKEAIQLSASSYGLEPYKVFIIENSDLRLKLKEVANNQAQVVDASHLLVFSTLTTMDATKVDNFISLTSKSRGVTPESLEPYANHIKNVIENMSSEKQLVWNSRQTYIALGTALATCAELNIDSCPMEGFDVAKFDEILGLKALGLTTSCLLTIGYRSEEDKTANYKKVRKPMDELFELI